MEPCYFVGHQRDVVPQDPRFDCCKGSVWRVSMKIEEDG
jgi:hypothetical protein